MDLLLNFFSFDETVVLPLELDETRKIWRLDQEQNRSSLPYRSHRKMYSQDLNPSNITEKATLLNTITLPVGDTVFVFDYPFSLSSGVIEV